MTLKQLIDETAKQSFVEGYKAPDDEVLGVIIAKYFKWNGDLIFSVAQKAFEDANFHSFNEKFEQLWEDEVNE